ncbi:hypothetical protein [Micromonospora sagamiensis]|uniref:Uncharacterized protein n=1 Tax=Micromonospora sagamiensis TaxID=47875 RepID=A0A562WEQ1_9ACTN|nr:hypothetical protein [Micromonospora sagamiensis]TWJ28531.1 hypothetical protein JD81_02036 [Micromonospora sagamiensis]BCL12568.1 hypothetical protein GCM10017556_03070 [Micromonospora sagamiensis]
MDRIDLRSRDELLVAAGLSVIGTASGWLDPKRAWQTVVRVGAQPDVVIDDSRDGYLDEVNAAWLHLAQSIGVISDDRTFLISVAGPGAFALPWALVRLQDNPGMAQHLVSYPGEPEFLTIGTGSRALCGVTTEEDGIWLLSAS